MDRAGGTDSGLARGIQDLRRAKPGSEAFGRKEVRHTAQQKPEFSWLSSGGVMLPGKHSSKVETRVFWQLKPRLRSTLAETLSASGKPPCLLSMVSVTERTTLYPPSLSWVSLSSHQLEVLSPLTSLLSPGATQLSPSWCQNACLPRRGFSSLTLATSR